MSLADNTDPIGRAFVALTQMADKATALKPLASVFETEIAQKGLRQAFVEGGHKVVSREFGTTQLRVGRGASYLHAEITDQARGLEIDFVGGRFVDDPFDTVGTCIGDADAVAKMVRELVGNYQKANTSALQS